MTQSRHWINKVADVPREFASLPTNTSNTFLNFYVFIFLPILRNVIELELTLFFIIIIDVGHRLLVAVSRPLVSYPHPNPCPNPISGL